MDLNKIKIFFRIFEYVTNKFRYFIISFFFLINVVIFSKEVGCKKSFIQLTDKKLIKIFNDGGLDVMKHVNSDLCKILNLEEDAIEKYQQNNNNFSKEIQIYNAKTGKISHTIGGLKLADKFFGVESTSKPVISLPKHTSIVCVDKVLSLDKNTQPNPQFLLPICLNDEDNIKINKNFKMEINENRRFIYSPECNDTLLFQIRTNLYNSEKSINFQQYGCIKVLDSNKEKIINDIIEQLPNLGPISKSNFKEGMELWNFFKKQNKLNSLFLWTAGKNMDLEKNSYNILSGVIDSNLNTKITYIKKKISNLTEGEFDEIDEFSKL